VVAGGTFARRLPAKMAVGDSRKTMNTPTNNNTSRDTVETPLAKPFVWPVCKHCKQSSKRLALLAMIVHLGAKAHAGPLECWANGGGEHEFE